MSTPSDTIRTDTIQGRSFLENASIVLDAAGSSLTTTSAGDAEAVAEQPSDALGMFLVDGDHEAAGVGLPTLLGWGDPDGAELGDRLREDGWHPLALQAERSAQSHRRLVAGELVLE